MSIISSAISSETSSRIHSKCCPGDSRGKFSRKLSREVSKNSSRILSWILPEILSVFHPDKNSINYLRILWEIFKKTLSKSPNRFYRYSPGNSSRVSLRNLNFPFETLPANFLFVYFKDFSYYFSRKSFYGVLSNYFRNSPGISSSILSKVYPVCQNCLQGFHHIQEF